MISLGLRVVDMGGSCYRVGPNAFNVITFILAYAPPILGFKHLGVSLGSRPFYRLLMELI